ncbi:MAG: hypothetical protein GX957_13385 [Clostridiaceae bacterium]|nr:hypothetical protein [Clostridiaceae bacterium]
MVQRFIVDSFKFTVSLLSSVSFIVLGGCMFSIQRWVSAGVFILLGLIFAAVAAIYGTIVHISSTGITKTILGLKIKELRWTDIAEVGVAGTKVFNRRNPEKAGSLYIYISETTMTDQARFEMMLKWPPLKKIFLIYNPVRLNSIQQHWSSKIQTYNTGDLRL